ncbi:MAG: enoyl-CoA hydratase-related protein [Thermoanaerobaculia bacterium]|nr:enoyl-CoA hydratase-related protein [Thermoanaerobaculia bacterium]
MLDPASYRTMLVDRREDGVALVTLNRPERLNAVNRWMHYEMARITRDLAADPGVRAAVFTGAGRGFCSGGDFGGGLDEEPPPNAPPMMQEAIQIVENLLDCPKPVLSAVNGYAMGLGANFALLCDVVVASRDAVFADTHVKMGIGAGDGGQVIWPLLMGPNRAKYYLMTGDRLSAEEAERLGLVNFVVEPDDLLPRALEIAGRLAKGPAQAIAASKVPLNRWIKTVVQQIMPLSLEMEDACFGSADAEEAGLAFREKREPLFGRG